MWEDAVAETGDLPAWSVRAYQPGDEAGLVALFGTVFGRTPTAAWWRWFP